MKLHRAAFAQLQHRQKTIVLQKADTRDLDTLVAIKTASFVDTDEESREAIVQLLHENTQRFYIGGFRECGMFHRTHPCLRTDSEKKLPLNK